MRQAHLDQDGEIAERTAAVKAQEAEVEAQRALEERRVAKEQERLRADVVAPANAEKEAAQALAEAEAAPILDRGKAQVEILRRLYEQILSGGDQAFAVFMAEKLPELLGTAVDAVKGVDIDRLVVLDSGSGQGVSNAVNQRVQGAIATLEGLGSAVGLDIESVLHGAARKIGGDTADGEGRRGAGAGGPRRGDVTSTLPAPRGSGLDTD